MLFALTDFLVVIGVVIAVWRIRGTRDRLSHADTTTGLALFALAALVGSIRFLSDQVEGLQDAHSLASSTAAILGTPLLALGTSRSLHVLTRRSPAYYGVVGALLLLGFLGMLGVTDLQLIASLSALFAIVSSGYALYRRRPGATLWLASWLLLLFASLAIGGSREVTTLGIAHWHIYHALLGVWAVLVGEAVRACTSHNA